MSGARLAHVSTGELYGGVEQFIYTYSEYLREHGGSPFVTLLLHKGRLFEKLTAAGLPVELVPALFKYDPVAVYHLYQTFRRHQINVVHTHGYKASILGGVAARLAGIRLVKTEHGALEPNTTWASFKMRMNHWLDGLLTQKLFDAVIYITHDLMDRKKLRGKSTTAVIHNGIPMDRIEKGKSGFDAGAFNIGIVGRLSAVKGHRVLLEALAVARHRQRLRLHVIGDGPLNEEIRRRAEQLGLEEQVAFLGFRPNVRDYMADLNALIMPSEHEGLPYTLLEAMYMNVPIVASEVGGLKEVLRHNETALLFPAGDVARLAAAIDALVDDPALGARLAERAHQTAKQNFHIEQMASQYGALYQRLAS